MSDSPAAPTPAPLRVRFVASDPSRGGLPVKRQQVQQACAACRRKKRRCIHADDGADDQLGDQLGGQVGGQVGGQLGDQLDHQRDDQRPHDASPPQPCPSSPPTPAPSKPSTLPPGHGAAGPQRRRHNGHARAQSSRFVGDLNPEAMFLEATASTSRHQPQKGDVGIWLSSSHFIMSRPSPMLDRLLLPSAREHCLSCVPPDDDFARLKAVFLRKIHPIFPVVAVAALDGSLDVACNVVVRQLVSLAAATDPDMSQCLRLENHGPDLLSPHAFSQSLSAAVRALLETSIVTDRVVHIQALAMLSLYTQPTCAEEADLPAQLGGRAIHHVQTLGLHLLRYDAPNCDDLNTLFCAVWALDRINAAVYGRPCLIHERDVGADLDACVRKCPPCFRLFLSVVQWLDQVIELYRPGPSAEASGLDKVAYIDLPVFEAMIVDADALKVPSSLVATIEILYHAVIILSCRLPRPGTTMAASTLPPPSANARRSLAAERVACAVPRDRLSPVPFVPYALSLALSVEYRKMRHSRLPMFRARAMSAFKRNCDMLRQFAHHFWGANVVAGLGERVLKEMERAATALTRDASPLQPQAESRPDEAGHQGPPRHSDTAASQTTMDCAVGLDHAIDFSLVDAVSGQDVFGHIDPGFNLDAVDDVLEANLDIGLPLNWGDWGQFAT